MKKIFTVVAALLTTVTFAQENISFETTEGFSSGTINNQNGWEVTDAIRGFLTKQVISNETGAVGAFSFKNANEPNFGVQDFPIFGAIKTFDTPADFNNFTISYDIKASKKAGADWEFTLFATDDKDDTVPVAGIGFDYTGSIYMIKNDDYGFQYAATKWIVNEWTNIKIKVTAENIKYYVNNQIQGTFPNTTSLNIEGFKMLHNNYGGDAYYDNFQITNETLSTEDFETTTLAIYPNPATNSISISSGVDISTVEIFAMNGQKVLGTTQTSSIDVSRLSQGMYLVQATDISGNKTTKKLLKK